MDDLHSYSLAILIPAYNQPSAAVSSVEFIARYIEENDFPIEVILSDNCSDDREYISELDEYIRDGWLAVHQQVRNIGFSANVGFLAGKSKSRYSMILGCGDFPYLEVIVASLERLAGQNGSPAILVGGVDTHQDGPPTQLSGNPLVLQDYRRLTSVWVPYQEAIPGQVYKTEVLKQYWPTSPITGNAWPHVEMALSVTVENRASAVRVLRPFVSMHQSQTAWYFESEVNLGYLLKHVFVLLRFFPKGGFGVVVKILSLLLTGLPGALGQDRQARERNRST